MSLTRRILIGSTLALAGGRIAQAKTDVLIIAVGTSPTRTRPPDDDKIGDEYIYDNLVFNGLTRMRADLTVVT